MAFYIMFEHTSFDVVKFSNFEGSFLSLAIEEVCTMSGFSSGQKKMWKLLYV